MKKLLFLSFAALLFAASCSRSFYGAMLTKAYVPDTIFGSGGNGSDGCRITKNGIAVKVEPFDINEYFRSPHYAKTIEVIGQKFPLVINLYKGMSVFRVTIQTPLISAYYDFDDRRFDDRKRMNEMAIRYDNRIPIPETDVINHLYYEKDKLPCYWQAMDLLEKKIGKEASSSTEMGRYKLDVISRSTLDVISSVIYSVRQDPATPLLNRHNGIGTGDYTSYKKNTSYEVTGYIVFPEVKKSEARDAKLEFLIAGNLFSFNVKSSLRYYKSAYDQSTGKYTPYVEITEAVYNAIEHEEALRKMKNARFFFSIFETGQASPFP